MITKDLPRSNSAAEKLTTLFYRLFIADIEDVDAENWPKAVNATIGTNPLKPGKVFRYLDVKASTIKPSAAPGESPYGGKLTIETLIEGISKNTLSWIYENVGKSVIVIWQRCQDGVKFIGGSPCSGGLQIKYSTIGAQDGGVNGIAITFEGGECPDPILFYEGEIPQEAATALTVSEGSVTVGAGSRYILTDNAAATALTAIAGVTDADLGRQIEFEGAGVNYPTSIANSTTFILSNQVSFSAAVGSRIIFLVGKSGTSYTFTEIYRG